MLVNPGGGASPKKHHKKSPNHFAQFYTGQVHKQKSNYGNSMYGKGKGKKHKSKVKHSSAAGSHPGSMYASSSGGSSSYSSGSGGYSGGGGGRRKHGKKGKGGSGYARRRAATMVKADTNSQLLALVNQARGQRRARDYDISSANALYGRTKGDLSYLFNEARDFNASQSAKIDERYGQTQSDLSSLFDNFSQQQDTQVSARKAAAMQELQRLGVQQSGMGNFDADAQNASSQAALSQANAMSNLSAMKEGSGEVSNLLNSMATGSQNSFMGQAMNTRNQSVADARQNFGQYMNDILGKTDVIRSQEFNKINDLALQLKQSSPMKRSKKNKRRVLKSYAAQAKRGNRLNKALGGVR